MKKPSPRALWAHAAALYVGVPALTVAKQVAHGGKVTQKLPPPIGLQVLTSAPSTGTDAGGAIGPVADLTLRRLIRMPEPEKPGQVQLPSKDTG